MARTRCCWGSEPVRMWDSVLAKDGLLRRRFAPCHDGDGAASHRAVIPRACGGSSTLRPSGSITDASEYWIARFRGRRRPGMWRVRSHQTRVRTLATRSARGFDESLAPFEGVGNAGCPLHPRPRVHFVLVERTRETTSTPESPGIPARNGFNGFLRALPGDRAVLPPSSTDRFCLSPVGPTRLRKLDASVGASGPHDFAVRNNISRPLAW